MLQLDKKFRPNFFLIIGNGKGKVKVVQAARQRQIADSQRFSCCIKKSESKEIKPLNQQRDYSSESRRRKGRTKGKPWGCFSNIDNCIENETSCTRIRFSLTRIS